MFNLDMAQHCLVAECWCPVEDLEEIQGALIAGTVRTVDIYAKLHVQCKFNPDFCSIVTVQ